MSSFFSASSAGRPIDNLTLERTPMRKQFNFKRSPEDEATYAKWRRAVIIFYGCVGLVAVATAIAIQYSGVPVQWAGN
jgi:hypothetical protein